MPALSDYNIVQLSATLAGAGQNPSNAVRVLREYWLNDGQLDLSTIPIAKAARKFISENLAPRHSRILLRHQSADGTIKLLIGFTGGGRCATTPSAASSPSPCTQGEGWGEGSAASAKNIEHQENALTLTLSGSTGRGDRGDSATAGGAVECVLMPSHRPDRAAACISSQIGCAMGCDFCASTAGGLERNLCVGEIVEQFMHLRAEARRQKRRIASLVFMGMGEPMHNLDHVIPAIKLLAESGLGGLGTRAITVSTVGIVPGIDRLAEANLGVHLALSLHAPDDQTRSRLVPSNRRWPVAEIMAAAQSYQARVKRLSNIEYCMLAGINDSDAQAALLADLMRGFRAHVNLIPYNAIGPGLSGAIYQRPSDERIARFARLLRDRGVVVHMRQTRGDDVSAACGQLRIKTPSAMR